MLPETGSISMSQVNVELKKNETAVITLNDTDVRKLAGKPSGVISMNDLRGKKNSEYVENYQIYSNTWEGERKSGSFTINFPKKVISGKLIIDSFCSRGTDKAYVTILGVECSGEYRTFTIDVPENTTSITGSYYTGRHINSNGTTQPGRASFTAKFTGEWEA